MGTYTLVTGASSGIGRAIAINQALHSNLILCGRDLARLEETKKQCANSENHIVWQCDLKRVETIGESLKFLMNGQKLYIHHFVHSAGIAEIMPLHLMSIEFMQETMNVNFFSAVEIMKVLGNKRINKQSLTNVAFISSIYSKYGAKGQALYSASKGAIDSFVKSMAVELAPNVRVNSILPGAIKTRLAKEVFENEDSIKKIGEGYLLGFGKTEEIAQMVEFLLSDKSKWITGQQFIVDGGKTAH